MDSYAPIKLSIANAHFNEQLVDYLETSYGRDEFVDVTLACEGQYIKAHKIIISASSPYLRRLIKANPHPHPIIILNNVGFNCLEDIVRFIYRGDILIEKNRVSKFLETARMLEVAGLSLVNQCDDEDSEYQSSVHNDLINNKRSISNPCTSNMIIADLPPIREENTEVPQLSQAPRSSCGLKPKRKNARRMKSPIKNLRPVPTLKSIFGQAMRERHDAQCDIENRGNCSQTADRQDEFRFSQVFVKEEVNDDQPCIMEDSAHLINASGLLEDSTQQIGATMKMISNTDSTKQTSDSIEKVDSTESDEAKNDPDYNAKLSPSAKKKKCAVQSSRVLKNAIKGYGKKIVVFQNGPWTGSFEIA